MTRQGIHNQLGTELEPMAEQGTSGENVELSAGFGDSSDGRFHALQEVVGLNSNPYDQHGERSKCRASGTLDMRIKMRKQANEGCLSLAY